MKCGAKSPISIYFYGMHLEVLKGEKLDFLEN
jgi:hypothetical protein